MARQRRTVSMHLTPREAQVIKEARKQLADSPVEDSDWKVSWLVVQLITCPRPIEKSKDLNPDGSPVMTYAHGAMDPIFVVDGANDSECMAITRGLAYAAKTAWEIVSERDADAGYTDTTGDGEAAQARIEKAFHLRAGGSIQ